MAGVSTAGTKFYYAVGSTTVSARPTALDDFTQIEGFTSLPEIDAEPSTLDTTTLENTVWKSSIPGLKDVGGALGFGFNLTKAFATAWSTLVTAAETAREGGYPVYFAIVPPAEIEKDFFFTGMPSPLGWGGSSVDAVQSGTAYITPDNIEGFGTKLTTA